MIKTKLGCNFQFSVELYYRVWQKVLLCKRLVKGMYVTLCHSLFCVQSRPALSLLGYCYYQLQDFVNAADCYEQLTVLNPEVDDYRLYYAQSLYKANLFDEAMKVSSQIDGSVYHDKVWCA